MKKKNEDFMCYTQKQVDVINRAAIDEGIEIGLKKYLSTCSNTNCTNGVDIFGKLKDTKVVDKWFIHQGHIIVSCNNSHSFANITIKNICDSCKEKEEFDRKVDESLSRRGGIHKYCFTGTIPVEDDNEFVGKLIKGIAVLICAGFLIYFGCRFL